jgi:beta-phosphoglucomutase
MIKLVIFDMDGVLTSTTDEHFAAWSELFMRTFSIELDPALEIKTKGVSRMASLEVLLNHYHLAISDSQKEILANDKNKHYQVLISRFDEGKLIDGVIQLLEFLKSKGLLLALGSASKNGPFLLKSLGIEEYFDYVVDPTELKSKPDPAIFLSAMDYFNLKSTECMGVEDAVAGVQAIKSAGMVAVGIGNEELYKADLIVNKVADLNFNQLEKLLSTDY